MQRRLYFMAESEIFSVRPDRLINKQFIYPLSLFFLSSSGLSILRGCTLRRASIYDPALAITCGPNTEMFLMFLFFFFCFFFSFSLFCFCLFFFLAMVSYGSYGNKLRLSPLKKSFLARSCPPMRIDEMIAKKRTVPKLDRDIVIMASQLIFRHR